MQLCKVLIADDEKLAREAIKLQLAGKDYLKIVAECADGAEALQRIRQHLPDIIFLDVQMPSLSGFEVLDALPLHYKPSLIIATAYDSYALTAYEHDAIDYLIKPFTEDRFSRAYQKALHLWLHTMSNEQQTTVAPLSQRLQRVVEQPGAYRSRIVVKDGVKLTVIPCDEILFIEAKGDYTAIQTAAAKYLHNESLSKLEESLDPDNFIRIHRSSIVNIHCIKQLSSHYNGDYTVILDNEQTLKLSRNYRKQLMKKMA